MKNARRMFLAMVINCAALLHVADQHRAANSLKVIRLHCLPVCSAFIVLGCGMWPEII